VMSRQYNSHKNLALWTDFSRNALENRLEIYRVERETEFSSPSCSRREETCCALMNLRMTLM
jgi:hypothetical protein